MLVGNSRWWRLISNFGFMGYFLRNARRSSTRVYTDLSDHFPAPENNQVKRRRPRVKAARSCRSASKIDHRPFFSEISCFSFLAITTQSPSSPIKHFNQRLQMTMKRMSIPLLLLLRSCCLGARPSRLAFSAPRLAGRTASSYSFSRQTQWAASRLFSTAEADDITVSSDPMHVVDGVICREISIELPVVGIVTVLEATAESQESLVDMALALDDEELGGSEQKLSAGDPYGAVLWPAAWAVAKYLLTTEGINTASSSEKNEELLPLAGLSILELGTGTGLVSMAAALGGAKVLATDYEPLALTLTEYAAKSFHTDKTWLPIETQILDMCDFDTPLPKVDIVVAADIMYEPLTGIAMAHRAVDALKQGSRVIVGDSPGRPGRPAFLTELKHLGVSDAAVFQDTIGYTCSGPRHELICGKDSTSVSSTPKELPVAIMELNPSMLS